MTHTTINPFDDDHLRGECAIFGIYGTSETNINTALGLRALQDRGQEAAGIVTFDGQDFLVNECHTAIAANLLRVAS